LQTAHTLEAGAGVNLGGIGDWNTELYNLRYAHFSGGLDLSLAGPISRNAILPDGSVAGLDLTLGDVLVVRDDDGVPYPPSPDWLTERAPVPVTVQSHMAMSDGGVLQLLFESDPWDSLISFEPGIPVMLGGTLELTFADDVDLTTQLGRTLRIFDWTGISPTGEFQVASPPVEASHRGRSDAHRRAGATGYAACYRGMGCGLPATNSPPLKLWIGR
jgi:hypothetical protein